MGFAPPALEIDRDCKYMKRREFLKSTAPAAVGVAAASYICPARAQSRKETLLTAPESGPNNLDIVGSPRLGRANRLPLPVHRQFDCWQLAKT